MSAITYSSVVKGVRGSPDELFVSPAVGRRIYKQYARLSCGTALILTPYFFTPLRALCIAEISRFSPEEENSPMCQETHKTIKYSILICLLIILAQMNIFVKAFVKRNETDIPVINKCFCIENLGGGLI